MAGSEAEREIREAVVAKLRRALPQARIIHELNVAGQGSRRIDLAAVTRDMIYGVEIKSEKDTLARLKGQMKAFQACCHHVIVVAHKKFFCDKPYDNGQPRFVWPHEPHISNLWCYPEPPQDATWGTGSQYRWSVPTPRIYQPYARYILHMLWADELTDVAARLRIGIAPRANMGVKIDQIAYHTTGKEIAEAVCHQLRTRQFAEADEPIQEAA